jgi:hypothetical protein
MKATRSRDTETTESPSESTDAPLVSAHGPSPERTVFTEQGNPDAWIATDTLVELEE